MAEHLDSIENNPEKQWIRRVLEGHKDEYAFLVNRYKNKIYGLLRGMGADHQDAQDLTQETFIKAYRKLASHETTKSFSAWLYQIAVNVLKDFWRSKYRREWLLELPSHVVTLSGPEDAILQEEHQTELQALIRRLPDNYRISLLLRYTNDLSYDEISSLLNVPRNKIQNDLYRAKKRLKQMLTDEEMRTDAVLKPR
ncbi:RNA polymerase sigma factor [Paenibacillus sp. y28]|uniref:RNA polymerase sigma factor n=1 Tax=Paenibacillus sp. y28 TaxID=3129110 RepID=UPI003019336E